MHRTNRVRHAACCGLLLGLLFGGNAFGQTQPLPRPPAAQGQPIFLGKSIVVPINGTQRLQMITKKRIATVYNEREAVARVTGTNDPSTVIITGIETGITHLTLIDENNVQETYEIQVQLDVEYLRTLILRAVPTATIQIVPTGKENLLITGVVARPEEADIVMKTAISLAGGADRVVNALRIGGVQQVQLDVVVADVTREEFRRMAFSWLDTGHNHYIASTVGQAFQFPTTIPPAGLPGVISSVFPLGAPAAAAPNVFLGITNNQQSFMGVLQALRDENLAKILTEPRIVALSGRTASFLSGGEQAVPVPAGLGQVGVTFEEFGTRVNFLPIVLGNGKIHLEIEPEVSQLNPAFGTTIQGTVVPGRTTDRLHTSVELEDGQTYVLGGLLQHVVVGTTTKLPILGDLPFIGAAFNAKSFDEREEELIFVVTPHLVDAMACDQAPKVLPGQETRSPSDYELFLEGILEAPRGPREVFPSSKYVPAYKNGPSAGVLPCGGDGKCGINGGAPGCRTCEPIGAALGASTPRSGSPDIKVVGTREMKPGTEENGAAAGAMPPATMIPMTLPPSQGGAAGSDGQKQ
jgi:pilus assembly protein CpaC